MSKTFWGALVLVLTILVAVALYCVVFILFNTDWWHTLLYACAVTFLLGLGIYISAVLLIKGRKQIQEQV